MNVPVGYITVPPVPYKDEESPAGWIRTDGARLVRDDFPELAALFPVLPGSIDAGFFRVPYVEGGWIKAEE